MAAWLDCCTHTAHGKKFCGEQKGSIETGMQVASIHIPAGLIACSYRLVYSTEPVQTRMTHLLGLLNTCRSEIRSCHILHHNYEEQFLKKILSAQENHLSSVQSLKKYKEIFSKVSKLPTVSQNVRYLTVRHSQQAWTSNAQLRRHQKAVLPKNDSLYLHQCVANLPLKLRASHLWTSWFKLITFFYLEKATQ